ncbi:hypothetical protein Pint_02689 [Pistacia integerrima]|uniref:Uncharacterized protein n=1 Tax=Pistacia integerrima TaxID=434235 RepID=A0ACC0ZN95_9ROSI|nr:hypothetical protein Pint_02689 [Pistacia integerrima]
MKFSFLMKKIPLFLLISLLSYLYLLSQYKTNMPKRGKKVKEFEDYQLYNTRMSKRNKMWKDDQQPMLSNFSDDILRHILSFVDTKYAVQTCVLSKRFKNLWKTLSHLTFDNMNFSNRMNIGGGYYFRKFVLHVFSHRDQSINIDTFSLAYDYSRKDESFMNEVTNYLVLYNIEELIFRGHWVDFCLPVELIIKCPSIKSLEMNGFGSEMLPGGFCFFMGLKKLHLSGGLFPYISQNHFDPFSSCPNLKSLYLGKCFLGGSSEFSVFRISGPQLVDLGIFNLYLVGHCRIEVCTPMLTSFTLMHSLPLSFTVVDLPALRNANVQFSSPPSLYHSNKIRKAAAYDLTNMFRILCHAQTLTLSYYTIEILSNAPNKVKHKPSPFTELKKLKVKVQHGENSTKIPAYVLKYLLSASAYGASLEVEQSWLLERGHRLAATASRGCNSRARPFLAL